MTIERSLAPVKRRTDYTDPLNPPKERSLAPVREKQGCRLEFVETLPKMAYGFLDYTDNSTDWIPTHKVRLLWQNKRFCSRLTFQALKSLFERATLTIQIVSFQWNLRSEGRRGMALFNALAAAVTERDVKLQIVHKFETLSEAHGDLLSLVKMAPSSVNIRMLHMPNILGGEGVLHAKLIVVDGYYF